MLFDFDADKYGIMDYVLIDKGWSGDKKYRAATKDGESLLLRISDIDDYDRKKGEYGMLEKAAVLGINASRPIEFGLCNNGQSVFQLLSWIEGEDVEEILQSLQSDKQYDLGTKVGQLLKAIHSLPGLECQEPWGLRFRRKMQARVGEYNGSPIRCAGGDIAVKYLLDNQHWLDGRPQTFNHGDFNITNIIAMPDGHVGVVDFNVYNGAYGDPWWEFDFASWGNQPVVPYATGLLHGYFDGRPPDEFFVMLSYYMAYDALVALCDTATGEQGGEPEVGVRHMENVMGWYDDMRRVVPGWYGAV